MSRRLGRGLDALIHAVEPIEESNLASPSSSPSSSSALPWPVEHSDCLSSSSLRLQARERLSELAERPKHGVVAALAYLDKLRAERGHPTPDSDLDSIDLTHASMLQLKDGRLARFERKRIGK